MSLGSLGWILVSFHSTLPVMTLMVFSETARQVEEEELMKANIKSPDLVLRGFSGRGQEEMKARLAKKKKKPRVMDDELVLKTTLENTGRSMNGLAWQRAGRKKD